MKGYIQVYTGNGKGKSTSSFGLILRALGAGLKVTLVQFIKSLEYSEIDMLRKNGVEIFQFGRGCFIQGDPEPEDLEIAAKGIEKVLEILKEGSTDLLVLDEINVAHYFKLFSDETLYNLLDNKPESMELVCTGRYAPDFLIKRADLVTEMKEIKHYYQQGVDARKGIES